MMTMNMEQTNYQDPMEKFARNNRIATALTCVGVGSAVAKSLYVLALPGNLIPSLHDMHIIDNVLMGITVIAGNSVPAVLYSANRDLLKASFVNADADKSITDKIGKIFYQKTGATMALTFSALMGGSGVAEAVSSSLISYYQSMTPVVPGGERFLSLPSLPSVILTAVELAGATALCFGARKLNKDAARNLNEVKTIRAFDPPAPKVVVAPAPGK